MRHSFLSSKFVYSITNEIFIEKEIKRFPNPDKEKIRKAINKLKENGLNNTGIAPMESPLSDFYRMVVWPYRVLFFIDEANKEITIERIAHRQGSYKNL
ncbi:type II toxin-antitoxin system RelE/ParE family toxin [Leptospira sp. WS92.C1]